MGLRAGIIPLLSHQRWKKHGKHCSETLDPLETLGGGERPFCYSEEIILRESPECVIVVVVMTEVNSDILIARVQSVSRAVFTPVRSSSCYYTVTLVRG
ncbi:hypothetical protein QQF64_018658 [Cirrhinus molitorella]|uniref:Uncharacterized protein n=1 Tax=Cirrhinus molitorella TaxID=172907 RepID=A0ABR3LD83_9TELE